MYLLPDSLFLSLSLFSFFQIVSDHRVNALAFSLSCENADFIPKLRTENGAVAGNAFAVSRL